MHPSPCCLAEECALSLPCCRTPLRLIPYADNACHPAPVLPLTLPSPLLPSAQADTKVNIADIQRDATDTDCDPAPAGTTRRHLLADSKATLLVFVLTEFPEGTTAADMSQVRRGGEEDATAGGSCAVMMGAQWSSQGHYWVNG